MSCDDNAPDVPAALIRLCGTPGASVGYYMQDHRNHVCPTKYTSLQKGLQYLGNQLTHVKRILVDLEQYGEEIQNQESKGWYNRRPQSF